METILEKQYLIGETWQVGEWLTRTFWGSGHREQLNQVTAFVDASHTYGSDVCESRKLRSFIGGRLNVTKHPIRGKDLLPQISEHAECKSPSGVCFTGGDTRASEQPGLTAIHTVFMREHNRIVGEMAQINPHWNDEQLFQNARRIMSAMMQHVTYNEFMPRVLGWNAVQLYDLKVLTDGYFNGGSIPPAYQRLAVAHLIVLLLCRYE